MALYSRGLMSVRALWRLTCIDQGACMTRGAQCNQPRQYLTGQPDHACHDSSIVRHRSLMLLQPWKDEWRSLSRYPFLYLPCAPIACSAGACIQGVTALLHDCSTSRGPKGLPGQTAVDLDVVFCFLHMLASASSVKSRRWVWGDSAAF